MSSGDTVIQRCYYGRRRDRPGARPIGDTVSSHRAQRLSIGHRPHCNETDAALASFTGSQHPIRGAASWAPCDRLPPTWRCTLHAVNVQIVWPADEDADTQQVQLEAGGPRRYRCQMRCA